MAKKHRRSKNSTVKIPHKNKKITRKNAKKSQKIITKNMLMIENPKYLYSRLYIKFKGSFLMFYAGLQANEDGRNNKMAVNITI